MVNIQYMFCNTYWYFRWLAEATSGTIVKDDVGQLVLFVESQEGLAASSTAWRMKQADQDGSVSLQQYAALSPDTQVPPLVAFQPWV